MIGVIGVLLAAGAFLHVVTRFLEALHKVEQGGDVWGDEFDSHAETALRVCDPIPYVPTERALTIVRDQRA